MTQRFAEAREAGAMTDVVLLTFECPRCEAEVAEHFYGPCSSCRDLLRAQYEGRARHIEVEEYTPKMNVTPNAVALKDD